MTLTLARCRSVGWWRPKIKLGNTPPDWRAATAWCMEPDQCQSRAEQGGVQSSLPYAATLHLVQSGYSTLLYSTGESISTSTRPHVLYQPRLQRHQPAALAGLPRHPYAYVEHIPDWLGQRGELSQVCMYVCMYVYYTVPIL